MRKHVNPRAVRQQEMKEIQEQREKDIPVPEATREANNGKTVAEQKVKTIELQNGLEQKAPDQAEEKATIEVSLYLRPSQDDKLEDLRRAYKKRMGKKISSNQVMRRLIDKATLEMLFDE